MLTFAGGLLVGAFAIHVAGRYVTEFGEFEDALLTALFGAIAWALVGWVPLVGTLLALAAWVGVIKYRYPVGWGRALLVGGGAWAVAVVVVAAFGLVGLDLSAFGVPGT
ncbi:hypothetical protein VB779_07800 [Haloarculaceae archaeon H-GB11]|nr:hypothetical protein [Haloarculaceae archaeon H-GB11]